MPGDAWLKPSTDESILAKVRKKYIPTLNERNKWKKRKPDNMVHHIVLVVDEAVPRSQWSTARVLKSYSEANSGVRSVKVNTSHSVLKRPISKLCMIESAQAA